jgi:hypothetical protein
MQSDSGGHGGPAVLRANTTVFPLGERLGSKSSPDQVSRRRNPPGPAKYIEPFLSQTVCPKSAGAARPIEHKRHHIFIFILIEFPDIPEPSRLV